MQAQLPLRTVKKNQAPRQKVRLLKDNFQKKKAVNPKVNHLAIPITRAKNKLRKKRSLVQISNIMLNQNSQPSNRPRRQKLKKKDTNLKLLMCKELKKMEKMKNNIFRTMENILRTKNSMHNRKNIMLLNKSKNKLYITKSMPLKSPILIKNSIKNNQIMAIIMSQSPRHKKPKEKNTNPANSLAIKQVNKRLIKNLIKYKRQNKQTPKEKMPMVKMAKIMKEKMLKRKLLQKKKGNENMLQEKKTSGEHAGG